MSSAIFYFHIYSNFQSCIRRSAINAECFMLSWLLKSIVCIPSRAFRKIPKKWRSQWTGQPMHLCAVKTQAECWQHSQELSVCLCSTLKFKVGFIVSKTANLYRQTCVAFSYETNKMEVKTTIVTISYNWQFCNVSVCC